jgi:peptide/nickel transport system substrate-binding protein
VKRNTSLSLVLLVLLLASCAPRQSPAVPAPGSEPAPAARSSRPVSIVTRVEPIAILEGRGGVSQNYLGRALFAATMSRSDAREVSYPLLANRLPTLNSDSWRVHPDGKMETVFALRPGLTWHDGTPFAAEDFVLGHRSRVAKIGWAQAQPNLETRIVEDVRAEDPLTVVVTWRQPYAEAATFDLDPLPRHILGDVLERGVADAYGSHPYWTTDYVGAGPYRLQRWEPGAYMDASAFEAFALGRPKLSRIVVTWSSDPNAVLARVLAGDVDLVADSALQFQQAVVLRREWANEGKGVVLLSPTQVRHFNLQLRPEYVNPRAMLDARVRRAIMHALDRQAIADAMLEGEGNVAESMIPPTVSFYQVVDRAVPKYPYDLRRTEALLNEAGFAKGPDGAYTSPTEGRFAPELRGLAEGQDAQETTIVLDFLRRAGINSPLNLVPTAVYNQNRDEQISTFPAIRTTYATLFGDFAMNKFITSEIATVDRNWRGTNRTGWSNAEFDGVYDAFSRALERDERNRLMAEMARLLNDQLPVMPMYFNFEVVAHTASLAGPTVAAPTSTVHGAIYEWAWR